MSIETRRDALVGDIEAQRLARFIEAHQDALDRRFAASRRVEFFGLAAKAKTTIALKASDGWISFQFGGNRPSLASRGGDNPWQRDGLTLYDYSDCSMDLLTQVTCATFVRVAHPEIEGNRVVLPAEIDLTDHTQGPSDLFATVSKEYWESVVLNHSSVVMSVVTPLVNVEHGLFKCILPYRASLCTPFAIEGGKVVPMYTWNRMDLWWDPTALLNNGLDPNQVANGDVTALEILLDDVHEGTTFSKPNVRPCAADKLDALCEELLQLLQDHGGSEETLHQWLKAHDIFLESSAKRILSKIPFGSHVSDFVIERANRTYCLCEIEAATKPALTESKESPSADLTYACQQVNDWRTYVREHVHAVRDVCGLTDIYEPAGMVVMGRSNDYHKEGVRRWRDIRSKGYASCEVFTYDDLVTRVRELAASLRKLL